MYRRCIAAAWAPRLLQAMQLGARSVLEFTLLALIDQHGWRTHFASAVEQLVAHEIPDLAGNLSAAAVTVVEERIGSGYGRTS